MREIDVSNAYDKDMRAVIKQGWDVAKIAAVVNELQNSEILPPNLRDHKLLGNLREFRECHVFGDLVIIYTRDAFKLTLHRIGRHQDLFKNYK